MSTRINLLTTTKEYRKKATLFNRFKTAAVAFGLVTFLSLGILAGFRESIRHKEQSLNREVEAFVSDTQVDLEERVKVGSRLGEIEKVTSSSVDFLPLYELVYSQSVFLPGEAQLQKIRIDKERNLELEINFHSKSALVNYLSILEGENFSQNFNRIVLNDVDLSTIDTTGSTVVINAIFNNENLN